MMVQHGSRCTSDNIKGTNNVIVSEKDDDPGKYVAITIATDGYYWIYLKDGYLYIDQYHEVIYSYGSDATISNPSVASGTENYLLYGTDLATLTTEDATFAGWKEENTGLILYPYVVKNATYTAVYVIGEDTKPTINKADYTVYYYIGGNLYGVGSISAAQDVLLPTITSGGKIIEWYLDANYTTINKVTSITATNHLTLYGKWVANN